LQFTIHEDLHIGIFDGYFRDDLLKKYIEYFDFFEKNYSGLFHIRKGNLNIEDKSICTISEMQIREYQNELENPHIESLGLNHVGVEVIKTFFSTIYPIYYEKYSILSTIEKQAIFDIKIQKTKPGQGYHTWHCENTEKTNTNRICAFMMYLNDVDDGGETEFLYQKFRVKPKANRFLIWPAGYTHVHRGNPPLSNDKYIITGWVEHN